MFGILTFLLFFSAERMAAAQAAAAAEVASADAVAAEAAPANTDADDFGDDW